ncbi:U4/U6.U5 snRNP associated protein [Coniosporium apollinis]|uniref:U4/U6.U5 snRNP associated protein n=1 Tax=Coniosporium apollinis TaxID=61459 RepID=A0ABQ9NZ37_9PEZI|nr:U4/U6.U5 snRNP associated protein [Coniosporium apollinis]
MADKTPRGAYGQQSSSDTSFRRTWDKTEYASRAAAHDAALKTEGRARYEAAAAGKKYIRRASTPPDAAETEARRQRLDVAAQVGKTMLVPAGSAVGKRGRGAGFYCEACDLTFKDNLQFVEHLNSRQHLVAVGQTGEVRRATVEEVRQTLRYLKRKREEESKEVVVDLGERLERRAEEEEKEREEKRRKRNERRRRGGGEAGIKLEDDVGDGVIR